MPPRQPQPQPPSRDEGRGRSPGRPLAIPNVRPEWWDGESSATETRESRGQRLRQRNPAPSNSRRGSDRLKARRNKGLYEELFKASKERTRKVLDDVLKQPAPPLRRAGDRKSAPPPPKRRERLPNPGEAPLDEQRRRLESFGTGRNLPKPTRAPDPGDVLRRRRNPQGDARGTDRASRPKYRRA